MMSARPREHDIVVAGGGLAGGSLSLGLAGQGWNVAMVEAVARTADHQPSHDDRTLVLNAASLNILAHLGLAGPELACCPIRRIHISREGGFGKLDLDAAGHGLKRFGAVVVARELGNRLLAAAAAQSSLTEYCPDQVEAFAVESDRVRVRLASGTVLSARLLVAADGTGSQVRQAAGMAARLHDYGQSAMIFNVRALRAPVDSAWERFTRSGPLAFLPQPEGRLGVVWIDRNTAVDAALDWSDGELMERLAAKAPTAIGPLERPGRRARYPLKLLRTEVPIAERVVAVGNAANTVHPVSAQGFNLGLRDVAGLLDVLEDQRDLADPGDPALLARYRAVRQDDQRETVRYTDTLARTFTNPSGLFRISAAAGLAAHALLPGLERRLVRAAMGFRGPVSRLAREPESR